MAPSKDVSLRTVLDKDKLNGMNYMDWICNLRIILMAKKKEEVLYTPLTKEPDENATLAEKNSYKKTWDVDLEVCCLMLGCMEPDLQMKFESAHVYDMVVDSKTCLPHRLELKGSMSLRALWSASWQKVH
jgi:hypothetical protein